MSFNVKEVIDFAIELEKAGYDFYISCAAKFKGNEISAVFSRLAVDELEHQRIFGEMLQGVSLFPGSFNEDYFLYLKALGGGRIYTADASLTHQEITHPFDALMKAMDDEKAAILLYSELLSNASEESRRIIEKIISEEKNHVVALFNLMGRYRGSVS